MSSKYIHFEELHNLEAPSEIVPVIIKLVNPQNVVDVGCGTGTFLKIFKNNGIKDVLGIDGVWCNKDLLFRNIEADEFIEADLEHSINLKRYFDLVICLEVAEHLSKERGDTFVADLVSLGNIVLFSAAIPQQGGINHINEQWPEYWEEKFAKLNYVKHDILKSYFWNKKNIWWWYKQNMCLYTFKDFQFNTSMSVEHNNLTNAIHPELYESKTQLIEYISTGKGTIYYYLKLLLKSFIRRIVMNMK